MRRSSMATLFLLPLLLLFGAAELTAQTSDVEGTWEITWETRLGESRSFEVTVHRDGDQIQGTAEIPRGVFMRNQGEGTETVGLMNGAIQGQVFTFQLRPLTQGHTSQVISVYGAVADGDMEGYMTGVMPEPETAVPFAGRVRY